jgi:hypothetical protein
VRRERVLEHLLAQRGHGVEGLARGVLIELAFAVRVRLAPADFVHRLH